MLEGKVAFMIFISHFFHCFVLFCGNIFIACPGCLEVILQETLVYSVLRIRQLSGSSLAVPCFFFIYILGVGLASIPMIPKIVLTSQFCCCMKLELADFGWNDPKSAIFCQLLIVWKLGSVRLLQGSLTFENRNK